MSDSLTILEGGGTHSICTSQSNVLLSGGDKAFCFSMERGWCPDSDLEDTALLRWLPVDDLNFGVWAYNDGTIMVRRHDGSVMTSSRV
jgi:hypothetical protein